MTTMKLLNEARLVLESFGYYVNIADEADVLQFEDANLLGFIWEASLPLIIENWETKQDSLLRKYASRLRQSSLKSWNLYMVCLATDTPTVEQQRSMTKIEEDFRGTRKIVQGGLSTSSRLQHALYPFIPIQNITDLETTDEVEKVSLRLKSMPQQSVSAILTSKLNEAALLREFLRLHDIKTD